MPTSRAMLRRSAGRCAKPLIAICVVPRTAWIRTVTVARARPSPGSYCLLMSMVQEGVAWFFNQGKKLPVCK